MEANKFNNVWAAQLLLAYLDTAGHLESESTTEMLRNFAQGREGEAPVTEGYTFHVRFERDGFVGTVNFDPSHQIDFVEDAVTGDLVKTRTGRAKLSFWSTDMTSATDAEKFVEFTRYLAGAMAAMQPATFTQTTVVSTAAERAEKLAQRVAKEKALTIEMAIRARVDAVRKNMRVSSQSDRHVDLSGIEGVEAGSMQLQFADYGGKVTRTYNLEIPSHGTAVLSRKS